RHIEHVPERVVFVDAARVDVPAQSRMHAVEVSHGAVVIEREYRDRRVLMAFLVLAAEVVLERAVARAQQAQPVPPPVTGVRAQRRQIGRGDDRKIDVLREMMRNAVDRKSTRLNSSHVKISYAVFCLKKQSIAMSDDVVS